MTPAPAPGGPSMPETETETETDVWRCETCCFYDPLDQELPCGTCRAAPPVIVHLAEWGHEIVDDGRQPVMLPFDRCAAWSDVPPPAVRAARLRAGRQEAGGPATEGAS
jgi:hypothetical protein